jgi:hypothetical protein
MTGQPHRICRCHWATSLRAHVTGSPLAGAHALLGRPSSSTADGSHPLTLDPPIRRAARQRGAIRTTRLLGCRVPPAPPQSHVNTNAGARRRQRASPAAAAARPVGVRHAACMYGRMPDATGRPVCASGGASIHDRRVPCPQAAPSQEAVGAALPRGLPLKPHRAAQAAPLPARQIDRRHPRQPAAHPGPLPACPAPCRTHTKSPRAAPGIASAAPPMRAAPRLPHPDVWR